MNMIDLVAIIPYFITLATIVAEKEEVFESVLLCELQEEMALYRPASKATVQ